MNRWKLLAAATGIAIVAAASAIGVDAALNRAAVLTTGGGTGIGTIRIATETNQFLTNSMPFVTVPGAAVNISVAPGATVVITADFTAETACYAQQAGTQPQQVGDPGQCVARIMIGGVEGYPQSGADFSIDSTDSGSETPLSYEGHAFSRSKRVTNNSEVAKNFSVFVQVAVSDPMTVLSVDDWHLRAMSISNGAGL